MTTIITPIDGSAMIDSVFARVSRSAHWDGRSMILGDGEGHFSESSSRESPIRPNIELAVNQIRTGQISRRKDRNGKGLLIEIAGAPMAYLPIIALAGRNRSERDARFASLVNAFGSTIEVAIVSVSIEQVKGVAVQRIKLSETKVFALRDEASRIKRQEDLIFGVAALSVGAVIDVTISSPATTKSDKNDGSQHCFGAFVDIPGTCGRDSIKGLLHVSEVAGEHPKAQRNRLESMNVGATIAVEVIEARVEGGRAYVRVSEKSLVLKKALARFAVGSKVSATVIASDVVGNEHGLILNLGGIKGFLPEADANVTSIESLTKSRGQTVKVTITGDLVEGMVKVTRKSK